MRRVLRAVGSFLVCVVAVALYVLSTGDVPAGAAAGPSCSLDFGASAPAYVFTGSYDTTSAYTLTCSGVPAGSTAISGTVPDGVGQDLFFQIFAVDTYGVQGTFPASFTSTYGANGADALTQDGPYQIYGVLDLPSSYEGTLVPPAGLLIVADSSGAWSPLTGQGQAAGTYPGGGSGGSTPTTASSPLNVAFASAQTSLVGWIVNGLGTAVALLVLGLGVSVLVRYVRRGRAAA